MRRLLTVLSKLLKIRLCMGCGGQFREVPKFSNSVTLQCPAGRHCCSVQRGGIDSLQCPAGRHWYCLVSSGEVSYACCLLLLLCCILVRLLFCSFDGDAQSLVVDVVDLLLLVVGYSHRTHYEFH